MDTNNYLERYKIEIETIGSLYIGSGHELGKKDWILDRREGKAYIIDELKLFTYLRKNRLLKSFENFMLSGRREGLYEWAKENKVINDLTHQAAKYSLDCEGIADVKTMKGIQTFIKDGYGKPYIPGSSVKGAIRNILLSNFIEKDSQVNNQLVQQLRKHDMGDLRNEADELDRRYFRLLERQDTNANDAVNDIMSGFKIADSNRIGFDRLTLCQKLDAHLNGDITDIPIFRECIIPETKFEMELTIDKSIFGKDVSYIEKAIENFLDNYNDEFLSKFKEEQIYRGNVIYLGGGAGYHTKTATSSLLVNEKDKVKITGNIINSTVSKSKRDEHRHYDDYKLGVSPHIAKLTEYDNECLQMGVCRINFFRI